MKMFVLRFFIILTLILSSTVNANEAGRFLFVFGKVSLELPDGSQSQASKGMALLEGSTIRSDKTGKAQIKLKDGGFLAVRPNTHLKIDEYAFNDEGRDDKGVVTLLKGTFRTISGAIAKSNADNVVVKTPVATIGIRGTDHEPAFIPANDPAFPPSMAPGLYDKVNSGATFIETDSGRLDLGHLEVGFVGLNNQQPVKLDFVPELFQDPNGPVQPEADDQEQGDSNNEIDSETDNNEAETDDAQVTQEEDGSGAVETSGESTTQQENMQLLADGVDTTLDDNSFVEPTITKEPSVTVSAEIVAVSLIQNRDPGDLSGDSDAFKRIEHAKVMDSYRMEILKDASGHVIGGKDAAGEHQLTGINSTSPVFTAQNGVQYGWVEADNLSDLGSDYGMEGRPWMWITGPTYQSTNITATLPLVFDAGIAYGGALTSGSAWGSLPFNSTNTNMSVDFTAQQAYLNIDVGNWNFNANMPVSTLGDFHIDQSDPDLSVTNNLTGDTYGAVSGSLIGADQGAIVSFSAKDASVLEGVTGVAAFKK